MDITSSMSPAQAAQQSNRTADGRYKAKAHHEVDLELHHGEAAVAADEPASSADAVYRELIEMDDPAPVSASLTREEADDIRRRISELGSGSAVSGLDRARLLYRNGVRDERTDLLFAGFGRGLGEREQARVLERMDGSDRERDAQFWSASVFYASRGHRPEPELDVAAAGLLAEQVIDNLDYTARVTMKRSRARSSDYSRDHAVDADDLRGLMLLDLVGKARDGRLADVRSIPRTYLTVARRLAAKMERAGSDPIDSEARSALASLRVDTARQLGRELSAQEDAALIEQVRQRFSSIPKKGAPSTSYYLPETPVPLSPLREEAGPDLLTSTASTRGRNANASAEQEWHAESTEQTASRLESMRSEFGSTRSRKHIWNIVSAEYDAPEVEEGTITLRQRAAVRRRMTAYGSGDIALGVERALQDWDAGRDGQAVEDLFIAFGDAASTTAQRNRVLEMMRIGGDDRAETLWTASVFGATEAERRRNPR